jgi:hypothetical protein
MRRPESEGEFIPFKREISRFALAPVLTSTEVLGVGRAYLPLRAGDAQCVGNGSQSHDESVSVAGKPLEVVALAELPSVIARRVDEHDPPASSFRSRHDDSQRNDQ